MFPSATAHLANGGAGLPSAAAAAAGVGVVGSIWTAEGRAILDEAILEVERELLLSSGNHTGINAGGAFGALAAAPRGSRAQPVVLGRPLASSAGGAGRGAADQTGAVAQGVVDALDEEVGGLVQGLHNRVRDYTGRMEWAQKAHDRWLLDKLEMEEQIEDLRAETGDLREQAAASRASAAAAAGAGGGGGGGGRYAVIGGGRARTGNEKMGQFDLAFDLDSSGLDAGGVGKLEAAVGRGRFVRVILHVRQAAHRLVPLSRDIRCVCSVYGRACGSFFIFQRFLLMLSLLTLLLHLPLFISYIFVEGEGDSRLDAYGTEADASTLCPTPLMAVPCAWFYGGFYRRVSGSRDPWLALQYLMAVLVSAGALLYLALYRWMYWDGHRQAEILEEELRPKAWSKLVLQAWDFRLSSAEDRQNWAQSFANRLRSLRDEEDQANARKQQTTCQKYALLSRRCLGMFLNVVLIACTWAAVLLSTVKRDQISKQLGTWLSAAGAGAVGIQIGDLAPNLVVSTVGGVLPTLTKMLTDMEKWPPAVRARHNLWRLYLGKILNVVVVIGLNVELIAGKPLYGQEEMLVEHDVRYKCVEDQAGAALFSLVCTEFLLSLALKPITGIISGRAWHRLMGKGDFKMPEFEVPDNAVDLIYFQCLLWSTSLLVPPLVFATPVLLFLQFKWLKYSLGHLTSRPFVAETCALSVTLLQLLGCSCLLFSVLAYCLAVVPLPHTSLCGPFDAGRGPLAALAAWAWAAGSSSSAMGYAKGALEVLYNNPGIMIGVICTVALLMVLQRSGGIRAHRLALEQLHLATSRQIESLENELWRVERHSELLKKRLDWHEKTKASA